MARSLQVTLPSEGGLVYLTVKFIVSQEVLTVPPSDGRVSSGICRSVIPRVVVRELAVPIQLGHLLHQSA